MTTSTTPKKTGVDSKVCQCIIAITKVIVVKPAKKDDSDDDNDDFMLWTDLNLKSAIGFYSYDSSSSSSLSSSSSQTTKTMTVLCRWEKRMRVNTIKKKLAEYFAAKSDSFTMQYPEYDGVLTCYETNEKVEFFRLLHQIKGFDVQSPDYFSFACKKQQKQQQPKSKKSVKKQDERFTHLLVNYNCKSEDVPFYTTAIFGSLNIDKIDYCKNEADKCFTALLTLRKKRSKAMLRFCINDYNVWYSETPIQLLPEGGILASHKKGNVQENEKFHSLVKLIRTGSTI